MKTFRKTAFILLIISNFSFFVFGWVQKGRSEDNFSRIIELDKKIEMKDRRIAELEELIKELEKKTTANI